MKRENFMLAIEKYQAGVVKDLVKRGIDSDTAHDSFQEAIVALLNGKVWVRFDYEAIDNRMYSYLKSSARNQIAMAMRKEDRDNQTFLSVESLTEKETKEKIDLRERIKLETECPFCHVGFLNEYKACGECHTIIGQGRSAREHMTIDEADLLSFPDLELKMDVEKALAKLTEQERLVVRTVVNGDDTLDGLAAVTGQGRQDLWRVYVKAKRKLQTHLLEYA